METIIPVDHGNVIAALRGFLRQLIESRIVEALLVPLEAEDGTIVPCLVTDPQLMELANPVAPVMPINNARALAVLIGKTAPATIGAVLRPCEIRAFLELVKLQQATLEGVLLISMDCPGTYEVKDYRQNWHGGNGSLTEYLAAAKSGVDPVLEGLPLRTACQMCNQSAPLDVAISIHLFGNEIQNGIPVTLSDQIAQSLNLPIIEQNTEYLAERQAAREHLAMQHNQKRDQEIQAIQAAFASKQGLAGLFATCINCHNCKTACPICYCKVCLFDSESFRHEPGYYLKAAQRKGVQRMLADTMLFHLTRMSHMSLSCVSCGMCTSACPMDIPVGAIFTAVGSQVQQVFGYQPGRNAVDALPLTSYQPTEWVEVGEER